MSTLRHGRKKYTFTYELLYRLRYSLEDQRIMVEISAGVRGHLKRPDRFRAPRRLQFNGYPRLFPAEKGAETLNQLLTFI
jgi:hypothetical protein